MNRNFIVEYDKLLAIVVVRKRRQASRTSFKCKLHKAPDTRIVRIGARLVSAQRALAIAKS